MLFRVLQNSLSQLRNTPTANFCFTVRYNTDDSVTRERTKNIPAVNKTSSTKTQISRLAKVPLVRREIKRYTGRKAYAKRAPRKVAISSGLTIKKDNTANTAINNKGKYCL